MKWVMIVTRRQGDREREGEKETKTHKDANRIDMHWTLICIEFGNANDKTRKRRTERESEKGK